MFRKAIALGLVFSLVGVTASACASKTTKATKPAKVQSGKLVKKPVIGTPKKLNPKK